MSGGLPVLFALAGGWIIAIIVVVVVALGSTSWC